MSHDQLPLNKSEQRFITGVCILCAILFVGAGMFFTEAYLRAFHG